MSATPRKVPQWKLMLIGRSTLVMKRLFVVVLAVLSLAVWTFTVISSGVVGRFGGAGAKPAEASMLVVAPRDSSETAKGRPAVTSSADEGAQWLQALAADQLGLRDPFTPSEDCFPKPKAALGARGASLKLRAGGQEGQSQELDQQKDALASGELAPLTLEGTLLRGSEKIAIIQGNSFKIDGQTKVLAPKDVQGSHRAGELNMQVKDVRNSLKVGEEIKIHSLVDVDGRSRISEESETLRVKEITDHSVVFAVGGKEYVLEMSR